MNTLVSKRQLDMAFLAFILIVPVIFYWAVWGTCFFLIDNTLEGDILMRTIFPRKVIGIPLHLIVFLLTAISLFFSVSEKFRRRTRWYKTPLRIRLGIGLGIFLTFLVFLQALMYELRYSCLLFNRLFLQNDQLIRKWIKRQHQFINKSLTVFKQIR